MTPSAQPPEVPRSAAHTIREIAQQPEVWRQVGSGSRAVREHVEQVLSDKGVRIILTGAGTSAFAGEVLAPGLRRVLRRRVDAVATTDIVANPEECLGEDVPTLLVSFARSGDSPESVAAVELADRLLSDVQHLAVTCNRDGALARRQVGDERSRVVLLPEAADDQGFAMTSSFTGMTLAALLALDPMADLSLAERLASVADSVHQSWDRLAVEVAARGYERVIFLGSGALKGLAHESALKVLELTAGRILAMGDSPLAFRHGPKSVLDENTLVVMYLSNDPHSRAYDLDLLNEVRRSRGAEHVFAVTADHDDEVTSQSPWVLPHAADLSDTALVLPAVLCAQLVALHCSMALGLGADNPFPSGEVNRVVRGVRIHAFDGAW